MSSYKPYEKYKNSGVEWAELIPEHWEVVRSKRVLREVVQKDFPDEPLLAATQSKGVILKSKYEFKTVVAVNNLETLKLVEPGNFVISLRSFQGGIEYAHDRGIISPAYTILELLGNNEPNYFRYLLKCTPYIDSLKLLVTGIREGQNIDTGKFKDSFLICPLPDEQTAIARFLDYKAEQIDRFIRKKKQLIKLLNEQKAAIINHAVTKGINPDAPMKDSGIEWLGEIPAHWEVRTLKSQCNIFGRIGFRGYKTTDLVNKGEGAITISPSNMKEYFMQFDSCSYLSWEKYEESPEIKVKNGNILFVKTGSSYGKATLVEGLKEKATINPQLIVIKDILCNPAFLLYQINSSNVKTQVELTVVGGTIPTIAQSKIGRYKILITSEIEQGEIVEYVNRETKSINLAIGAIEKEITLAEEYRTALIAEAVTGKIDVREYKIPETVNSEQQYEDIEEELSIAAEDEVEYETQENE